MYCQRAVKILIRYFLIIIILLSIGCAHHLSEDFKNAALTLNSPQMINEYQQRKAWVSGLHS